MKRARVIRKSRSQSSELSSSSSSSSPPSNDSSTECIKSKEPSAHIVQSDITELVADQNVSASQPSTVRHQQCLLAKFISGYVNLIQSRYLRLIPLLAIVYYFKKFVLLYLGSGPFWDYGFNKETYYGACREENWLTPFTFMAAFLPISKQCLLQSWTVSCDIFFVIIMGPILLIMTRKPKLAAFMAMTICAISCILVFDAVSKLDSGDDLLVRDLRAPGNGLFFNKLSSLYTAPQYRIFSVAVGMLAGYTLVKYDESSKRANWPSWFTGPATYFSFAWLIAKALVMGNHSVIRYLFAPYHMYLFPWFYTVGRTVWSATNAIIMMRMVTDWKDKPLIRAGSNQFWSGLAKLSYAILLTHYDLLIWDDSTTSTHITTRWTFVQSACTAYLLLLSLSAFLYIVFEYPIDKLTRKYLIKSK